MAMADTISMKNIGNELKHLRDSRPGEDENIYTFGEFLADRLGINDLNPQGFYLTLCISLSDLENGIDGYTGKAIKNNLVDLPSNIYSFLLITFMEDILDIVCPNEFAKKVKEVHKNVNENRIKMF